jgi:hydrogenase maturation factor
MGKLKTEDLKEVLKCIKKTSRVIVPPMPGFDSGAHELGNDKCVVVSTDPCIGVPEKWFGWFLIHYAASDVALFGAPPRYCTINLLGPSQTATAVFRRIMKQACEAADELNMTIITGHTGTYDELRTVIGTCTAYGIISRNELITPAGARPGDYILFTKPLGLETTVNFALTRRGLANEVFGPQQTLKLVSEVKMQTCVQEALLLAKVGGVHAMHDATEGGLVAALNEIADASGTGFKVEFAELPIAPELERLGARFRLTRDEILATSSTGSLLAAVSPDSRGKAVRILSKRGLKPKIIGVFMRSKKRLLQIENEESDFPSEANDPYAKIMA